jgi:nitroreductase
MDVFEAIRTTRAMRRLDPDRDVSDADLLTILEAATRGPSGGNLQPVRWLVVRDPELKRRIGDIYRELAAARLAAYAEMARHGDQMQARNLGSYQHLAEHMGEAPALVIPCARGQRGMIDAAVYPAVQNLMLAARALGLGTTLTRIHIGDEDRVKALLGIPDDVLTFAIIPVGYPLGRWGEAPRRPVREVVYWNRWEEPPPEAPVG